MKRMNKSRQLFSNSILTGCFLSLLAAWGVAHGETTECTPITYLPYTVPAQGVYCLTGNLSTNQTGGAAITINKNNVTIDLNGYKIGGLGAGDASGAIGINSTDKINITIRNGIVRGFFTGIQLTGEGHVIEDVRAEQNLAIGIRAFGNNHVIRRNLVLATGGHSVHTFANGLEVQRQRQCHHG